MFELILQAGTISEDGSQLTILEQSDWVNADHARDEYGVFIKGIFRMSEDPVDVNINGYSPLSVDNWVTDTQDNGRYSFTSYAFIIKDLEVPEIGDVHVDESTTQLVQWTATGWVSISLEDAILQDKAYYTSGVLEVPFLAFAYAHKNLLNLEYVKQVKHDIDNGATQNKLYYKRTDLDYFTSLILGAEYNWVLELYSNFYQVVTNLNSIISTGKIS